MKKTFTANISGTVFHIEEDAYDRLHRYLAEIRAEFAGMAGREEILADIEARIAELFQQNLNGGVITLADVDHVESVMGKPEDFGAGDGEGEGPATGRSSTYSGGGSKRLFRDGDDKWVGGVLAGIAAYFHTEALWLRIAFIVFLVLGWGSPILIYMLLWVLIPKATTAADRLHMRGEPVTVDSLKRTFAEGAEHVKAGTQRVADEAEELGRKWNSADGRAERERYRRSASAVAQRTVGVLGRILGAGFLLFGALLAFLLLLAAVGRAGGLLGDGWVMDVDLGQNGLADHWFQTPGMGQWAWAALILVLLIPVLGLITAGIRLLFDVRIPRWFGWGLGPVWVLSIGVLVWIGVQQAVEFRQRERVAQDIVLSVPAGVPLRIGALHDPLFGNDYPGYRSGDEMIDLGTDTITWGSAALDVQASNDSLYHLEVVRRARGGSVKEALRRARAIGFRYTAEDDHLQLWPNYTAPVEDKLRNQTVRFIVRVPLGRAVHFERSSVRLIDDIYNTTGTHDRDMVGRTWSMTGKGLAPGEGVEATGTDTLQVKSVRVNIVVEKPAMPKLPNLAGLLSGMVTV